MKLGHIVQKRSAFEHSSIPVHSTFARPLKTTQSQLTWPLAKAADIAQLLKLRLATLVVFSAVIGYFVALDWADARWTELLWLVVGGFLVTGSSNAFNQVMERHYDKLMTRTANRPLPAGRMGVAEAIAVAAVCGIGGLLMLWLGLNPLSGILGFLALFLYVAVYTPLKRVGSIAVFVGAFPGAIPPMLGYVAVTGRFGLIPGLLFAAQFIWQFPHFWAIAWRCFDEYKKAGFHLMPSGGRTILSARYILLYTAFMVPISVFPALALGAPWWLSAAIVLCGLSMLWPAILLLRHSTDEQATKLMFASFFYLPAVQLLYLFAQ